MTGHGRLSAVLIAPEDLERLEESLEIMRDAAMMNRLAESDAELARGEFVSAEELAEVMSQRRGSGLGPARRTPGHTRGCTADRPCSHGMQHWLPMQPSCRSSLASLLTG